VSSPVVTAAWTSDVLPWFLPIWSGLAGPGALGNRGLSVELGLAVASQIPGGCGLRVALLDRSAPRSDAPSGAWWGRPRTGACAAEGRWDLKKCKPPRIRWADRSVWLPGPRDQRCSRNA